MPKTAVFLLFISNSLLYNSDGQPARRAGHARPRSVNVRTETTSRKPNTRLDVRPAPCPVRPPIAAATVPHSDNVANISIHPSIQTKSPKAIRRQLTEVVTASLWPQNLLRPTRSVFASR